MARRVSPSQLRNMIRQAHAKQKRAIDEYNRAVRKYNSDVKRSVDNYDQAVRAHNAQVRANRQRIHRELAQLNRASSPSRSTQFHTSSQILHQTFIRVQQRAAVAPPHPERQRLIDLSEQETANSLAVLNALSGRAPDVDSPIEALASTTVTTELSSVSQDLDHRWKGALFALNPDNLDAARHFCTSAREVFTQFLEMSAPDAVVFQQMPACDKTHDGRPTRRSRIRMLLNRKQMPEDEDLEEFVSQDIENILDLFDVFNQGTHGTAGRFSIHELASVKRRVEDGIVFLASIVR